MLQAGDPIPNVTLVDESGTSVTFASLLDRPTVLYFYPKDDTPGCTAEACKFRDDYEDFTAAGAQVIGVSADDAAAHARFKAKHRLPFRLLSDPNGSARAAFGVPKTLGFLPGRATFVITNGTIVYAFNSQFAPAQHVQRALAALRSPA
jgi:thioredoxin-dependent peroxiredoxin